MGTSQIWHKGKLIEFMAPLPLFKDLNVFQLEKLQNSGQVSSHKKNQVLFSQGDIVDHIFVILEGSVKAYRTSEQGDEAIVQLLLPSDTFMESYIFLNQPALISAQAITESTILTIPSSVVRELASTDAPFSQSLLRVISKRYQETILKVDSLLVQSPVEKIGHYFLTLLVRAANTHDTLKLPFQKLLIAQYLGMKPETFSRALSEIRKSGICIERDEITIRDPFSLCQFCVEDILLKCKNRESARCIKNERG